MILKKLFLALTLLPSVCFAQDLVVRDFQTHPTDRTAMLTENRRNDNNGKAAALLKIKTPLMAKDLTPSGDSNGFVGKPLQAAPGEVWIYAPERSKQVTFTHPLGTVSFRYPSPLKSGQVYTLILNADGRTFSLQCVSDGNIVNGAEITIDGNREGVSPLNVFVPYGLRHVNARRGSMWYDGNIRFTADSPEVIQLVMEDEEKKKGNVAITTLPQAEIWIDGHQIGVGKAEFRDKEGVYVVETRMPNADPGITNVTVTAGKTTAIDVAPPVPHMGLLDITTVPANGVKITLDDDPFERLQQLNVGRYKLNFSKRGYYSDTRTYDITRNVTLVDTVEMRKIQYVKDKTLYLLVGYDISKHGGPTATIGGVFKGFDLSVSYTLGLQKTNDVKWFDKETNILHGIYNYKENSLGIRLGYQFRFVERFSLTPQLGYMLQELTGGELGKGARCNSLSIGARTAFFPFMHMAVFVAPHYAIPVKKGEEWSILAPFAGLSNGGFSVSAGLLFNI